MFGIHDLTIFIVAGFLLNITPGPDTLLIMTKSATQGWRAGCAAAWGIGSGVLVHVLAAALGLSAILASSAMAFTIVKIAGAAYLVYIGIAALIGKARRKAERPAGSEAGTVRQPLNVLFVQGFLTNALNPKVALFFLAFVPQFIHHDSPCKALAFLLLGCIFNLNSMIYCHLLAVLTALARQRLKVNQRIGELLTRTVGVLFISLGAKLALAARS